MSEIHVVVFVAGIIGGLILGLFLAKLGESIYRTNIERDDYIIKQIVKKLKPKEQEKA